MGRFLTSTTLAILAAAGAQAAGESGMWGQCGGINWSGPTKCVSGAVCTYQNDWYCQWPHNAKNAERSDHGR